MNKISKYIFKRKLALLISIIYVGLGTLSVCSIYPFDPLYGDWSFTCLILTFPVSIISFGFRYGEANLLYPVIIIQFVVFILFFLIISTKIKL